VRDDEKRRREEGKERKETYIVQLSTCKLVDLVDVHGEAIDDGLGDGFDTRLDSKSGSWKVRRSVRRSCVAAKSARQQRDQFL